MSVSRQNVEFLIAHLKELEYILQACTPDVFTEAFDPQKPIVLTGLVPSELSEKLETIIDDCDTASLDTKALRAATAIADSASLLLGSIKEGTEFIVAHDPTMSDEENFLAQYYITPPKLNETHLTLVQNDFIDAKDYARKALELVKTLARKRHYDIDSLDLQGELYL